MGLGLSDTVVGGWEAINRPAGCIYDGTVLKFNSQTSSLRNCGDDGYDCACMATTHAPTKAPTEAPTKAPTQAPTLAPTTKTPTQAPTSGDFIRIYDGTCTESGYDQITSALQCEAAANGLGLAATVTMDRTKQVHNGIRTMGQGIVEDRQYPTQWRPVGCYREGAVFRFNNYVPNKLWTAEQEISFLKRDSFRCDGGVDQYVQYCICLVTTNEPTAAPTSYQAVGGFIRIETGTCTDSGNRQIATTAECEAAAIELGLSDTVVGSRYTETAAIYSQKLQQFT